jgi:hypothetical protein
MFRFVWLAVAMVALVQWLPSVPPANAQGIAACPRSGTIIKGRNSLGDYTATLRGADPSDSSVCVSVGEGPGAGINYGKEVRRIYGWFDLTNLTLAPDQQKLARDSLAAVLNGSKSETTFELTFGVAGRNYIGTMTDTLVRTGQAPLTIDGRPVNTIALRDSIKGGANSQYDGDWSLWYDPASHLFVKGHVDIRSGGLQVRDFEVTAITAP